MRKNEYPMVKETLIKKGRNYMKQVGNLAIVCAQRKDTLMTLSDGKVKVVAGDIAAPVTRCAKWDDDETISQM